MDDKDSDVSGERRSGFRSYVDSPRSSLASDVGDFIYPPVDPEGSLDLLEGEVIVTKAKGVLRYFPLSDQKRGISGLLIVTNFKLTFSAPGCRGEDSEPRCEGLTNSLLKHGDICLSNIDSIYSVTEDGRRRRLSHQLSDGMRIDVLEIQCKDFHVASYGFKFTSLEETKQVTNALLHHAFPKRIELLFAFECKLRSLPDPRRTRMFYDPSDWHAEMQRTKCSGWRVSYSNEHFQVCYSLPKHLVVPQTLLDKEINEAAPHYNKNRVPVWVWGTPDGAALVHSAKTAFEQSPHEEGIKQAIAESHPTRSVHFIDLDAFLPTSNDVQDAFVRWRSLHVPCTSEEFREGDNRYFSEIHSSQWLHYASKCLREACEIAIILCEDRKTVVLQEGEGRDMALLVSSLIQVLADPYFRTQVGFQSLIQKEWVALGHPFCSRFSRLQQPAHQTPVETNSASVAFSAAGSGITTLTANPTGMAQSNQTLSAVPATMNVRPEHSGQSPVFLLFLDCVWQVLRQYPKEFDFTETFLTAIWDSTHVSIFDTFLFDCVKDRDNALQSESDRLTSRSVWTWEYQYEPCYLEAFESTMTRLQRILTSMSRSSTPDEISTPVLNGSRDHDGVPMRRKSSAGKPRTAERADRNTKSRSIPITTLFSRMRRGDFSMTNNLNMDSINWEHGLSRLHEGNDGPRICDLRWNQLSDYARDLQMDEPDYPMGFFEQRIFAAKTEMGRVIVPRPHLSRLEVWNQLYSRWLPVTHIRFGGEDAFKYMTEMSLIEDIIDLKERIQRLDNDRSIHEDTNGRDDIDEISRGFTRLLRMENLVSSFPFSSEGNDMENGPSCVESITGFTRHYSNDDMLDSQSFIENQDAM